MSATRFTTDIITCNSKMFALQVTLLVCVWRDAQRGRLRWACSGKSHSLADSRLCLRATTGWLRWPLAMRSHLAHEARSLAMECVRP